MNRKEKIFLINKLEIGEIPIEMFQKPKLILNNIQLLEFRSSRGVLHNEEVSLIDFNSTKSGINPYTGDFYGIILVSIIK